MFKLRRWWLLCGAVLVGVVALNGVVNGVVDAKVRPAPRAVCVRGGATATDGVSGRGLVCVQTKVRGLRWRFQPAAVTTTTTTTSPTTTTTTTVPGVVAPVLVSVSASDGVRVTVAGMRPDTGVYSLQWVPYGQSFNTYQMARATSASMSVPAGWFACNRTYTFRVFVMQADWQLADGHQTQNVTHHSTPFDVVMPACPAPATAPAPVAPLTCATGGACAVGDTGPGGGIVFYVSATNFTSTGSDCGTTCKYLEAAPSDQSAGIVWATTAAVCYNSGSTTDTNNCQLNSVYSGDSTAQAASRTAATAIGMGMANTNQIYARLTTAGGAATNTYAAGIAFAYANNGKTDWHLPSKDELNELCKYARTQTTGNTAVSCANTGTLRVDFLPDFYWSSSEFDALYAWAQGFLDGSQDYVYSKSNAHSVRPVRAFGGTVACADGGACAVGDTGPGGGIVFYVSADPFTSTGSDCGTTCKYLEAATSDQSTGIAWCSNTTSALGTTATAIGTGMANTTTADTTCTSGAIQIAADYANSGKTDWHLPSKDELNELCKYAKNTGQAVGGAIRCSGGSSATGRGFSTGDYWSSSEIDADAAWFQSFDDGYQNLSAKFGTGFVRPVRAF